MKHNIPQNVPQTSEERSFWLKKPENRDPIKRGGAGAVYYRGDLSNLDSIDVVVSTRSGHVGAGLAHFGGLAEEEDDVSGDVVLTGIRNALREGQEEMEELLGYQPDLHEADYIFLYTTHDDKFFINNGTGFPVEARLHACEMGDALWQALFPNGATTSKRHPDHEGFEETEKAEVLTFKQALARQEDYHYPHEYFALWAMAAQMTDVDILTLAQEVSKTMAPERVDFTKLAADMFVTVAELEEHLGPSHAGALQKHESDSASMQYSPKKKGLRP